MDALALALSVTLELAAGSLAERRPVVDASPAIDKACTQDGKKLHGRVKVVDAFADFEVKVVDAFPDLRVKVVTAFPDSCGEWMFVDSFPDFTVKLVDAFPDFTIKYVDAFPGLP